MAYSEERNRTYSLVLGFDREAVALHKEQSDFSVKFDLKAKLGSPKVRYRAEVLALEEDDYRSLGVGSVETPNSDALSGFMNELAGNSAQAAVKIGVLKPEEVDEFKEKVKYGISQGLVCTGTQMFQDIVKDLDAGKIRFFGKGESRA